MMEKCEHERIQKNYPFGRKSKADKFCKKCGTVITNKMIVDKKKKERLKRRSTKSYYRKI